MLIRAGELGPLRRGIPKRRGYANKKTAYPELRHALWAVGPSGGVAVLISIEPGYAPLFFRHTGGKYCPGRGYANEEPCDAVSQGTLREALF